MTPGVAVLGDFVIALVISFIVIIPVMLAWRKFTRGLERRAWSWYLAAPGHQADRRHRVVRALLTWRLRGSVRLRRARYSLRAALGRGLQLGLPVAAIIAATAPVFGMSWYFDTENWAAGMWNSWAEERTDTWRAAMVEAEEALEGPGAGTFALAPVRRHPSLGSTQVSSGLAGHRVSKAQLDERLACHADTPGLPVDGLEQLFGKVHVDPARQPPGPPRMREVQVCGQVLAAVVQRVEARGGRDLTPRRTALLPPAGPAAVAPDISPARRRRLDLVSCPCGAQHRGGRRPARRARGSALRCAARVVG